MNQRNFKKNWPMALLCLSVIAFGIAFYFVVANITHIADIMRQVNQVLTPIYAGAILAFLLLPIHEHMYRFIAKHCTMKTPEKTKSFANGLAVFGSILVAFWVIYMLFSMLIPELYATVQNLFSSFSGDYVLSAPEWLLEFFANNPELYHQVEPYYLAALEGINGWFQTNIVPTLSSFENIMSFAKENVLPYLLDVFSGVSQVVGGIFVFVKDTLVAVIVAIYILARKRLFAGEAKKLTYALLPLNWANLVLDEVRNAYRIMSGFINGKLLDSFIIGLITLVSCNILEFPYPILIATIIGVTNIIPFFGPFIGGVPCGVLIFFVSPLKCLYFIVFIVVLQQFDGNILGPKILGDSTGLNSFWVLFSIILFGGMFGLGGMILGVPIFATFYSIVSRWVKHLLRQKDMPEDTSTYVYSKRVEPLSLTDIPEELVEEGTPS